MRRSSPTSCATRFFRQREDSDLLVPAQDLSAIFPDAAIDWLGERGAEIALGTRVTSLEPDSEGWRWRSRGEPALRRGRVRRGPVPGGARSSRHAARSTHFARASTRWSTSRSSPCTCSTTASVKLRIPMVGLAGGHVQWVFDREALSGARGLLAAVMSASGPHTGIRQRRAGHPHPSRARRRAGPACPRPLDQGDHRKARDVRVQARGRSARPTAPPRRASSSPATTPRACTRHPRKRRRKRQDRRARPRSTTSRTDDDDEALPDRSCGLQALARTCSRAASSWSPARARASAAPSRSIAPPTARPWPCSAGSSRSSSRPTMRSRRPAAPSPR